MQFAITAKIPKDKFGHGIDWERAAEAGLITLNDPVEDLCRGALAKPVQGDCSIKPKSAGMGEITFFHKKHVEWNGCEVCHAEVFKGGKWGVQQDTRDKIRQKHFSGVCHATVAFPIGGGGWCYAKAAQ